MRPHVDSFFLSNERLGNKGFIIIEAAKANNQQPSKAIPSM